MDLTAQQLASMLVAILLGALIGLERELSHKPLGLRTNSLISLGACIFTIMSIEIGLLFGGTPDRMAAQVVGGIKMNEHLSYRIQIALEFLPACNMDIRKAAVKAGYSSTYARKLIGRFAREPRLQEALCSRIERLLEEAGDSDKNVVARILQRMFHLVVPGEL